MIHAVSHLSSGLISLGLAGWESSVYTKPHADVLNDMTWCFLIAMSVFNFVIGASAVYIGIKYLFTEETERYAIHISTGFSLWGLILFFRYPSHAFYPAFYWMMMVEMIWFFTRVLLTIVISCLTCKLPEEK